MKQLLEHIQENIQLISEGWFDPVPPKRRIMIMKHIPKKISPSEVSKYTNIDDNGVARILLKIKNVLIQLVVSHSYADDHMDIDNGVVLNTYNSNNVIPKSIIWVVTNIEHIIQDIFDIDAPDGPFGVGSFKKFRKTISKKDSVNITIYPDRKFKVEKDIEIGIETSLYGGHGIVVYYTPKGNSFIMNKSEQVRYDG